MNWPHGITLYRGHAWFASPQAAEIAGEQPMTRVARAVEKGETQGFMRILVDGDSAEIRGPSLLGTGCDEMSTRSSI